MLHPFLSVGKKKNSDNADIICKEALSCKGMLVIQITYMTLGILVEKKCKCGLLDVYNMHGEQ